MIREGEVNVVKFWKLVCNGRFYFSDILERARRKEYGCDL